MDVLVKSFITTFQQLHSIFVILGSGFILLGCYYLLRTTRQFKVAMDSLQESEKNYRVLVETIPSIVFKGYADGSVDFFDDKIEKLTGYAVEDFHTRKMKWPEIVVPDDVERAKRAFKQALKTNRFYIREYRIKIKSGAILWIREKGHIICDEKGKIAYVTGICSDNTLKHDMDATLQENEKNFRMLVKTIPSIIFKGYADGSADFFDDKFEKVTGYPVEDFNSRKMKWPEIILPEDAERAKEIFQEALKTTDKSYLREYRIKARSGAVLWMRERGHIICYENGQIAYVSGICTDISQQHEMEAALEKVRLQNEMILNSIGEGLFELDQAGEVIFVNPATTKMMGYEARELVGRNLHKLIHHKKADGAPYREEECPIYATLKDGRERKVTDDVFWTKTGEALPVAYVTTPVEENGRVVGVVGAFRDITWRKRGEAELKRANQYLENIFDNSAEAIGIVDSKGIVQKWNKACEFTYGYTYRDMQGKPVFDLYADKDELAKMMVKMRQQGFVKHYEITMKRKDGNTFPCSLSVKVLRDENGKTMGSVTVARDLTEDKEREAQLKSANERLQVLVNESNQRNRHMSLLQEMSDVFQSCQTSGETYSAIAHFVPQFFPDYGGGLYLLNNSKNLYEMTATWGEAAALELAFGQDECWSLRRTRAYLVADPGTTMNCRHVSTELPGSYLCVPMMAQGEVMGILHLRQAAPEDPDQMKAIGQFATTVAEAMALALANLKLRETLRNQAIRDGLTGLFNRRYLEETLDRELSRGRRSGAPMGVIMLDLDHFKEYNDTFGHNAGDELLCALGQLIQDEVRKEDIACRYGGEEFLLIMPGAPMEIALERANELNLSVKQLHTQNTSLKRITISAGVAIFPEHGATGKEVIRAADAALYRAKAEGRDRVVAATTATKGLGLAN